MAQTLLLDVLYTRVAVGPFVEGGLITAKPNGAVWKSEEMGENTALVTLTVEFEFAVQVSQNLLDWKVDNIDNPTTAVPV